MLSHKDWAGGARCTRRTAQEFRADLNYYESFAMTRKAFSLPQAAGHKGMGGEKPSCLPG